jgi:alginate O-acetyltransferase complex protein AlgI
MVFNSITFLVFSVIFFPIYFLTKNRIRLWWILLASYVFYGWWDWRFLSLIMISTFMDFNFGKLIGATDNPRKRKSFLIFSMIMNLGFLCYFKYFNFFIDSFVSMMHTMGFQPSVSTLQIILPIGISFYTFQSLSYTIDIYRREIPVEHNMLKFAAFIALFPQLVAGPIVRARDLLPQMNEDKKFDWDNFNSGLGRVLWGFFKKVAIADSLAPFVDQVWAAPFKFSSSHLSVGVIFYSFQIYCDFSGYSDIAIGLARIMGYKFVENFKTPYFSQSFSEFWTRWHISLSSWLRDYLYIPLGGNRKGKLHTYKNNMLTMLIGGLWHGANLAFIFWGFLHGMYLIVQRVVTPPWRAFVKLVRMPAFINSAICIAVVYTLTCFAWIYFRAGSMGHKSFSVANQIIGNILTFDEFNWTSILNKYQVIKGVLLIMILLGVEITNIRFSWNRLQLHRPAWRIAMFACLLWMIALFGTFSANSFIYFQF